METKYVFHNALHGTGLEQCIRKVLELHDPVNIDELCRETGYTRSEIRASLDALVSKGEVERLRPWKYDKDDLDYFRLPGPFRGSKFNLGGNRWWVIRQRFVRLFCNGCGEGRMEHYR